MLPRCSVVCGKKGFRGPTTCSILQRGWSLLFLLGTTLGQDTAAVGGQTRGPVGSTSEYVVVGLDVGVFFGSDIPSRSTNGVIHIHRETSGGLGSSSEEFQRKWITPTMHSMSFFLRVKILLVVGYCCPPRWSEGEMRVKPRAMPRKTTGNARAVALVFVLVVLRAPVACPCCCCCCRWQ